MWRSARPTSWGPLATARWYRAGAGHGPESHLANSSTMAHRSGIGRFQMKGLMQDYPLTTQHMLWRLERLFDKKEIVTRREAELHRYRYSDLARRVHQLANVLARLG